MERPGIGGEASVPYAVRRFSVSPWGVTGALTGVIACLTAAAVAGNFGREWVFYPFAQVAVLVGAAGAWVGGWLGRVAHDNAEDQSLAARIAAVARTPVHEAHEGVVRVAGVVRARRYVTSPLGCVSCVAFAARYTDEEGAPVIFSDVSGGGVFDLDDGSGELAEVDAAHVALCGARAGDGGEALVHDGVRVEVVGEARWVPASDEPGRSNHGALSLGPWPNRAMAMKLAIRGTPEAPVILARR